MMRDAKIKRQVEQVFLIRLSELDCGRLEEHPERTHILRHHGTRWLEAERATSALAVASQRNAVCTCMCVAELAGLAG
jgi:hypothetical protein